MLFVSTFDVWVDIRVTHCSTVIALMCVAIQYSCMYDVYSELFKCGVHVF